MGRQGNIAFEEVQKYARGRLREREFVDAVSRSLREGRILILIAGDGIREGTQSLTELVNRNATKAFSFGLIEVALYRFGKDRLAIQPRLLMESEVVTREVVVVTSKGDGNVVQIDEEMEQLESPEGKLTGKRARHKEWWTPLLNMKFDDPEQEAPFWVITNNLVLKTPFPGIRIKAWATIDGESMGVFVAGTRIENVDAIEYFIRRDKRYLIDNLPKGTAVDASEGWPIILKNAEPMSEVDRRAWLERTLKTFVNVLRPRLRKWYEETQR